MTTTAKAQGLPQIQRTNEMTKTSCRPSVLQLILKLPKEALPLIRLRLARRTTRRLRRPAARAVRRALEHRALRAGLLRRGRRRRRRRGERRREFCGRSIAAGHDGSRCAAALGLARDGTRLDAGGHGGARHGRDVA